MMRNKYFILVLTFLCILVGQSSYAQDWQDVYDLIEDFEDQGGHVDYYDNYEDYADAVNNDDNPYNDIDYGDYGNYDDSNDSGDGNASDIYFWTDSSGIHMMYDGDGRVYADMNGDGRFDPTEVVDLDPSGSSDNSNDSGDGDNSDDGDIYDGLLDPYNYYNDLDDPYYPYDEDQYPPGDDPNNDDNSNTPQPPTPEPPAKRMWYQDKDGDGYFSKMVYESYPPTPYYKASAIGEDCDDSDPTKNLGTDCGMRKWYSDWDGDRFHSDETDSEYFPGEGWILDTKGVDCDESDPTITNQCYFTPPVTCKNCPPAVSEVAIIDIVLPENTAQYGYVDPQGNVYIKSEDGSYKKPSQLNPNSASDRTALNNIAASLARSIGGLNKNIAIGVTDGDMLASKNPAFTRTPPGTAIFFNSKGGFSEHLDNVENMKSILKHEIFHVDDNIYKKSHPNIQPKNILDSHADVYVKAANDPTYEHTTEKFRIGNAGSFANYLLNMDKSPDATVTRDVIAKKIEAFNKNVTNVKVRIADIYPQKGALKLQLVIDGKLSDYIEMTPVDI